MSDVYVKVEGLSDSLLNNVSVKEITEEPLKAFGTALENVKMADVLSLVRCKDCKYRKKVLNCNYGECMYSASMVTDNDFCSNGEVKTNEQEQWDV